MRFFLEFVSCYGCLTVNRSSVVSTASSQPLFEEPPRPRRRRKRSRLAPSGEWRPSLCSISEEYAVPQICDPRNDTAESGREVKRRGRGALTVHQGGYSHDHGFRGSAPSAFMPAFSPTPFMF